MKSKDQKDSVARLKYSVIAIFEEGIATAVFVAIGTAGLTVMFSNE